MTWSKSRARLIVSGAAIVLVGGAIALAVVASRGTADGTDPRSFVLPRLGAPGTIALDDLKGKPLVANFFASWCSQCQAELPGFAEAATRLRGRVTFLEVDSLDSGNGQAMASSYGLRKAGALLARDVGGADRSGLHDALGGGNGMPITAFYGGSGNLLTVHLGAFNAPDLHRELDELYGLRFRS